MKLQINGVVAEVPTGWQNETLLSVLREQIGLVGTKYGCGVGLCGACTVLIDGVAQRSCLLEVRTLASKAITTIEGLANGGKLHSVQQAWIFEAVPQCGYCQAGQIMSTVALLKVIRKPTDAQIDEALAGNLCRCGTHQRIRCAVRRVAEIV
jgi:isoquinoline 1-oxidoreductase subunit alpha